MIEHTGQTEWVEGRGILVWLAFFFIELGAGTFLVSSMFGSLRGMVLGWLICALLGGGLHLLYLGHPLRFWRILVSSGWKTSWISRGLYFVGFFLFLGGIHIILTQWASPDLGLLIAGDIFAFLSVMYGGLALSYVHGIPLWNSGLLPVLFCVAGLWGGAGVTILATPSAGGITGVDHVEELAPIFLGFYILLVIIYLMSATYYGTTGKLSVREMLVGKRASIFWLMTVGMGMALPLGVAITSFLAGIASVPPPLVSMIIILELVGDLSLRYCILKFGFYNPLVSSRNQS